MAIDNGMFGRIADLEMTPHAYYDLVRKFNRLIQREFSKKLAANADRFADTVTLITTGSDARWEKGSAMSPLETIALVRDNVDLDAYKQTLIQTLNDLATTKLSSVVEVKDPTSSLVHFNSTDRVQPGRIADARLLHGTPSDVHQAKHRMGEQIIGMPRDRIVEKVEALERDARRVMRAGSNKIGGKDAIHFELKPDPVTGKGKVWYDPSANQLSFKVGPLRLVQNTLLAEEIKHTRRENTPGFISTLRSSIVRRLQQLSDDNMASLSDESIREVVEHYQFFLRLYHRSENAYEQRGEVVLELEPDETEEVARRIQDLSALMEKFRIRMPQS